MGSLNKAKRIDLISLCEECGIEPPKKSTIAVLIKLIKSWEDYDEDFINDRLEVIVAARKEKAQAEAEGKKLRAEIKEKKLNMEMEMEERKWRIDLEEKYREREFEIKKIELQENARQHIDVNTRTNPDGISHTVEILDTAGSHHFPAMRELSIRSGRGFLLVYSIDSLQSFREAVQLWELIIGLRGTQVPVVLVGNKCDLEVHRQVALKTVEETTAQSMNGCKFFEASAKYDLNVKEVFLELLQIARNLEEAQEALLEEQDLFRRKSRRLSKRLSRKLSVFNSMAFNLKKPENPEDQKQNEEPSSPTKDLRDNNQKCVIL